jgi:purine-cytosine permease-like protein
MVSTDYYFYNCRWFWGKPFRRCASSKRRYSTSRRSLIRSYHLRLGHNMGPTRSRFSLYMPSKTPKWNTFLWTFAGIYLGSTLAFLIGLAFATLLSNPDPLYNLPAVYDDRGVGGLVGAVFEGHGTGVRGFGRFIEVLLALSITGANIPNIYSFGISVQAISSWAKKIPRVVVTLFGFSVALTVSCILRDRFVEALSNFMNILSYW